MNSLQIYEIKDIQDIITDYQTQFEKIDKLEKELYNGDLDLDFSIGMNKYKITTNFIDGMTLYLNNKKISNEMVFQSHFYKTNEEFRVGVYQYITKKIIERYSILPFNEPYYFDCITGLLNDIFGSEIQSIIDVVEKHLILDIADRCEDQHVYIKYNRNFFCSILNFLDKEEPYMVRDNWYAICNFFGTI